MSKFKLTQTAAEVQDILNNSLQKPTGLDKTKLVGVGVNGQENIEIGDNLTLANGKLSAAAGGLPSTITFDGEGNRKVGKNLKVDGKLTLKSLVSASNPDGDITKELGGGEGIKVVGVKNKWETSGSSGSYYWYSGEPKSNTAYEIGTQFTVRYQHSFPIVSLEQNQILVPTAVCGNMISNIESGDVVIIPTNVIAQNLTISSTDNKKYKVSATMLAYYVVIKAGTTGTISNDMTHKLSASYQYSVYTLA